jgi:hypothetical protein
MSTKKRSRADEEERPGTGALCPEAQADGVPCFERDRDCEICGKAALHRGKAVGDFTRELGRD